MVEIRRIADMRMHAIVTSLLFNTQLLRDTRHFVQSLLGFGYSVKVSFSIVRFLLVDISTSFGEELHANVSLLRNRTFDLISQSGWNTHHATISCELDFLFARSCAAIALPGACTLVFEHLLGAFRSKSKMK